MKQTGKGGFAPLFVSLLLVANPCVAYDTFERTIPELQAALASGAITSEQLVRQYLDRIAAFDQQGPAVNAMLYVNPGALEDARALDAERTAGKVRGPLHGIPIVLKDNYDTRDMPTTAGAVAMAGHIPPDDGVIVQRLRAAGAVFIGKTNLHEFARGIETVGSLGGYTRNPYDPGRNPGGSSGGTGAAVAANFAVAGMGTDTCGSIRIPATYNNLYGLRVTQGLSNVDGIVPLSHTQDVAGPLARSMIDLATLLDITADHFASFTAVLERDALQGARLGVLSAYLETAAPNGVVSKVIRDAIEVMGEAGADIVELEIEGLDELLWDSSVIDMEFPGDLDKYLRDSGAPVQSLAELLESGEYHAALESRYRRSITASGKVEEYHERLARREKLAELLVTTLDREKLDALVYPTMRIEPVAIGEGQYGSLCRISAHSGLPAISVPAGFTAGGLPAGIELLARPHEDDRLVALGYAWEQLAQPRRAPSRTPSLVSDVLEYEFEIRAEGFVGRLQLDRPTQMLHYSFELPGTKADDIIDIKLHRGSADGRGPVIELLGNSVQGSVAIRNGDLEDLLEGRLYVVVYTANTDVGKLRGGIRRKPTKQ